MIRFIADGDGHQYVARITGRQRRVTFAREFVGVRSGKRRERTMADLDEPGLYEVCDVGTRGKEQRYRIIVEAGADADGEPILNWFPVDKGDALRIGREIGKGRQFGDIVRYLPADPAGAEKRESASWEFVPARDAENFRSAQTVQTATESCWQIIQPLPPREAKKVLAALKRMLSPPAAGAAEPAIESTQTEADQ